MKWIRPLSLALAVLAAMPGLCQAQLGIWAPLSLPVLFGQENAPPASGSSSKPATNEDEFGIELGGRPILFSRQSVGQFEWTAGQPTPCEPCQDFRQLVEASWNLFNRRTAGAPTVAVYRTSVPMGCREESSCCSSVCGPYAAITRVLMRLTNASSQCPHDCKADVVEVCPATCVSQPAKNGSVTFGIHCKASKGACPLACTANKFSFGPFEIEISLNNKSCASSCVKEGCGVANPACKQACETKAACTVPACNPVCPVACSEVRVRADGAKCSCKPAGEACCPDGKCACVKKAVKKKCGCGKECGCCSCKSVAVGCNCQAGLVGSIELNKKTAVLHERIEKALRQIQIERRAHADVVHPVHGFPIPGTVMPPLPVTISLPPPPAPPTWPVQDVAFPVPHSSPYFPVGHPVPPHVAFPMPLPSAPVCVEARTHVIPASSAVKLQTPLFDAQCDSLTCGSNADELILEGNVKVTHKRTSANVSAQKVVINTRTGTMRAERTGSMTVPVSTSSFTMPTPPMPMAYPTMPVGYEQGPHVLPQPSPRPFMPMGMPR